MNHLLRPRSFILCALCAALLLPAADRHAAQSVARSENADALRVKIGEQEAFIAGKPSADMRLIHMSALADLYSRFHAALERDIGAALATQSSIGADNIELRNAIAKKIDIRREEWDATKLKWERAKRELGKIVADVDATSADRSIVITAANDSASSVRLDAKSHSDADVSRASRANNPARMTVAFGASDEVPLTDSLPPLSQSSATAARSDNGDSLPAPKIDEKISEGEIIVVGSGATPGARVRVRLNGKMEYENSDSHYTDRANRNGRFRVRLQNALKAGDEVQVAQSAGGKPRAITSADSDAETVIAASEDTGPRRTGGMRDGSSDLRGPFGMIVGGNVISQQAQNFSQADPFLGFTAGYTSQWDRRLGINNGRFNIRFQGLFNAAPRTAAAPPEDATATAATDAPDLPFLSSRKSFDLDIHTFLEYRVLGSRYITLGPYFGIGASAALDKNELRDEEVRVEGDGTDDSVELDTSRVVADNDLKSFYEFGPMFNVYLPDRGLFLQSMVGYGRYEALKGLYEGYDTRKRFVGKLRIFPLGLNRAFNNTPLSPMFGVDLNASRGQDSLRFFTGFAIGINKGFRGATSAAARTDQDGNDDASGTGTTGGGNR